MRGGEEDQGRRGRPFCCGGRGRCCRDAARAWLRLRDCLPSPFFSSPTEDPQNPSFGFIMQYLNGDKCYGANGVVKQRRSLRLWLLCDNDSDNVPDDEVTGGEKRGRRRLHHAGQRGEGSRRGDARSSRLPASL